MTELPAIVKVLPPTVKVPLVNVSVPLMVGLLLKVTPFELFIVRLLNVLLEEPPIASEEPPLKLTVPELWVKVPLLEKSPVKFMVPDVEVRVQALMVSPPKEQFYFLNLKSGAHFLVKLSPVMPPPKVILPVVPMLLALPSVIAPL